MLQTILTKNADHPEIGQLIGAIFHSVYQSPQSLMLRKSFNANSPNLKSLKAPGLPMTQPTILHATKVSLKALGLPMTQPTILHATGMSLKAEALVTSPL